MHIANPIYDTVFKYLMEDLEIAKGLLSLILNQEIVDLSFYPQESIAEHEQLDKPLRVYRIDFAAIIRDAEGGTKKVLIELQKTRRSTNTLRFRRYLAENYQKEDIIVVNGEETKQSLEIVTVYFLGYPLDDVPTPVLHVTNTCIDVTTGKTLAQAGKEPFIRLLNHESYIIQIKKLHHPTRSRLERILDIFNQVYKIKNDDHVLNFAEDDINEAPDPLLNRMVNRLTRAIADTEMRRKMNLEEETEREYQNLEGQLNAKDKVLAETNKLLSATQKEMKKKEQEMKKKEQALSEKDKQIEALLKQLADKK